MSASLRLEEPCVTYGASPVPPAVLSEPEPAYTPAAVVHLFNNAIAVPQTRRLILARGLYVPGRGVAYAGLFYDSLRDDSSDASLTLVVPALLRPRLRPGSLITFRGFIARKVVPTGGRIELHLHLSEVLEEEAAKFSEEDVRALGLQQQKAALGYADVAAALRARLLRGEVPRLAVIVGRTAIIDQDIRHQIGAAESAYDLIFHRTALTQEAAILHALEECAAAGVDAVVISRGGGEGVEMFNSCALAEACLALSAPLLTAIGHKDDVTLVQRIADRAFITPTAFGQFLVELHESVLAESSGTTAALVEKATREAEARHAAERQALETRLEGAALLHRQQTEALQAQTAGMEAALQATRQQLQTWEEKSAELRAARRPVWLYVLVAALLGVLTGFALGQW